jgi:enoyl-CoA hydratase/carnithine racemase
VDYKEVVFQRSEGIAIITLSRPERLNTFSTRMARELSGALRECEEDPEVRVVLIKGAGKAFSTGIDLTEFPGKTPMEYRQWVQLMEDPIRFIAEMGKPVIVAAHGYAVANGIGLLAAADLAVVAEDTKLGATAINVGLFCMGPAVPIAKCVGRKKALELVLTGDMIDAREAERIGLVNKVVPPQRLEEESMALARKLAAKGQLALQLGKRSFYGMSDLAYGKALDYTCELFASLCTTEDAKEGISAFQQKRAPEYKGR